MTHTERATEMIKPATIKIADFYEIYNNLDAATLAKLERQAAKADTTAFWLAFEKLTKKIGCGAVRFDGPDGRLWWFPVVAGKADRKSGGYQHSTAAYSLAAHGQNVRNDVEVVRGL
jgi:hypothetical protein